MSSTLLPLTMNKVVSGITLYAPQITSGLCSLAGLIIAKNIPSSIASDPMTPHLNNNALNRKQSDGHNETCLKKCMSLEEACPDEKGFQVINDESCQFLNPKSGAATAVPCGSLKPEELMCVQNRELKTNITGLNSNITALEDELKKCMDKLPDEPEALDGWLDKFLSTVHGKVISFTSTTIMGIVAKMFYDCNTYIRNRVAIACLKKMQNLDPPGDAYGPCSKGESLIRFAKMIAGPKFKEKWAENLARGEVNRQNFMLPEANIDNKTCCSKDPISEAEAGVKPWDDRGIDLETTDSRMLDRFRNQTLRGEAPSARTLKRTHKLSTNASDQNSAAAAQVLNDAANARIRIANANAKPQTYNSTTKS